MITDPTVFIGKHGYKDRLKAEIATQFIGLGSPESSTRKYFQFYDNQKLACTGEYTKDDIIFVSINGRRPDRFPFAKIQKYIDLGIQAGVSFIADSLFNRNRSYNIGEKELEQYLLANGYYDIRYPNYAIWIPNTKGNK
jgi:hypothetical protein